MILQDPLKVSGRRMGMNIKIGRDRIVPHLERGREALSLFRLCVRLYTCYPHRKIANCILPGGRYSQPSRKIANGRRVLCAKLRFFIMSNDSLAPLCEDNNQVIKHNIAARFWDSYGQAHHTRSAQWHQAQKSFQQR